jgi:hypothetical protein
VAHVSKRAMPKRHERPRASAANAVRRIDRPLRRRQDIQIAGPMIKIGATATAPPYKARNNHWATTPTRGSHQAGGDEARRPWIASETTAINTIAAATFNRRTLLAVRKRFMS